MYLTGGQTLLYIRPVQIDTPPPPSNANRVELPESGLESDGSRNSGTRTL